jgi:hypothetical protein
MATATPHNAITQRMDILIQHWIDFSGKSNARVCRWLVSEDELQMLEAFRRLESSEHGQTNDLFFRLITPFTDRGSYSSQSFAEFKELFETDADVLRAEGMELNWQVPDGPRPALLLVLQELAKFLADRIDLIGLMLTPGDIEKDTDWLEFLRSLVQAGIPERVRLILVDTYDYELYAPLAAEFPQTVITIEPQLDMPAAMQELASMGDPEDPAVQYRKLFVEASQAGARKDFEVMQDRAEQALAIAANEGWYHLQVSVLYLLGTTWIGDQQVEKALEEYGRAKTICQSAMAQEEPAARKLLIQVLLASGAAYFTDKKFAEGATEYQEAVVHAREEGDAFLLLESCRMQAYCLERDKQYRSAWESLWEALEAGAQLDEATSANSTLPYVGQALLRLMPRLGEDEQEQKIRERLVELVGPDWEQKIVKRKGLL